MIHLSRTILEPAAGSSSPQRTYVINTVVSTLIKSMPLAHPTKLALKYSDSPKKTKSS